MWWQDLFFGYWNGLTGWVVFIVHLFGGWPEFPFFDFARSGNWYDFGFLLGAGSPLLGSLGTRAGSRNTHRENPACEKKRFEPALLTNQAASLCTPPAPKQSFPH